MMDMEQVNAITGPLSDVVAAHMDRINAAANVLATQHPEIYSRIDRVWEGMAAAVVVCHLLSRKSGWWDGVDVNDLNVVGTKLCLIHSEVSEALEGVRKECPDAHLPFRRQEEVELADAVIRIFDLAGARGLDLAGALIEKLAYNQQRADHKPEARSAEGGKKI